MFMNLKIYVAQNNLINTIKLNQLNKIYISCLTSGVLQTVDMQIQHVIQDNSKISIKVVSKFECLHFFYSIMEQFYIVDCTCCFKPENKLVKMYNEAAIRAEFKDTQIRIMVDNGQLQEASHFILFRLNFYKTRAMESKCYRRIIYQED